MRAVQVRIAEAGSHAPHYGKDWGHVTVEGRAVSFAATDRYRLAWSTILTTGDDESSNEGSATFLIDAKALAAAVKSLPKSKRGMPENTVRFTFDQDTQLVTLDVFEYGTDLVSSVKFQTVPGSFPKYQALIPDVTLPDYTAEVFHVNAAFVADFAKAAVKVHGSGTMRIAPRSSKACAVATAWVDDYAPRFSAILMPVRTSR
jgi:DNA polymerase III sliding clamp (beta) subunit (PCNA family)